MKKRMTTEGFIAKSKKKFGDTLIYDKTVYRGCTVPVTITCKIHGDFTQRPSIHWRVKLGCPACGVIRKHTKQFIKEAKKKHGDLYDYSKTEYSHCQTKITIICRKHGEFQQVPDNHLKGYGCGLCGYEKCLPKRQTQEQYIEKFAKVHGDRYDYSRVKYKTSCDWIDVICKLHGVFTQLAQAHRNGSGCPKCGCESRSRAISKTTQEFVDDAQKVHGNRYSYEKTVYVRVKDRLTITCKKHGDFKMVAGSHLYGSNCPKCAKNNRSAIADEWLDSLGVPEREYTIPGTRYKVDGYDPIKKICYEFLGAYFHGHPDYYAPEDINPTNKKRFGDLYRDTMDRIGEIKTLGYTVVIKWETPKSLKPLNQRLSLNT